MLVFNTIPLSWWENAFWTVPVMGATVCLLAYLGGRSFLSNRKTPAPAPVDGAEETFLKGVTRERRSVPRRSGNYVEAFLSDGSDEPPVLVWVADRSAGGVKLLVEYPLPEGGMFKIRASRSNTSTPWLDVIVRSCRQQPGGQWEIGCQFPHPPAWNLLLQFG